MTEGIKSRVMFFGDGYASAVVGESSVDVKMSGKEELTLMEKEIPLKGAHNMDNVACSALVSMIMGFDGRSIREGVSRFKGLGHRFERMGDFNGIEVIDDSKATNIDATRRALESVEKRVVLIAGGIDKGGDYLSIMPLVKDKVKAMVLIGEAKRIIRDAFASEVFAGNPARRICDFKEYVARIETETQSYPWLKLLKQHDRHVYDPGLEEQLRSERVRHFFKKPPGDNGSEESQTST